MVDEFSEIKKKLSELKKSEEEFKEKLIQYSKQFGIDVIYGSNMKCSVKEFEKIIISEDREDFIQLLKDKGLYETYSMLCSARLNSHIMKGELTDKDICDCIEKVKDFRLSLSKRKDVDED